MLLHHVWIHLLWNAACHHITHLNNIHMCNWEGWTMQAITLKVQLRCGSVSRSNHIVKESMLQLSLYCIAYESHGNWSAGHSPKRPNQGRKRRQTSWRLGTDWHNLLVKQQKLRIEDLSKCNCKCVCLMFCLSYLLNVFESFPQTESLILAPQKKRVRPLHNAISSNARTSWANGFALDFLLSNLESQSQRGGGKQVNKT